MCARNLCTCVVGLVGDGLGVRTYREIGDEKGMPVVYGQLVEIGYSFLIAVALHQGVAQKATGQRGGSMSTSAAHAMREMENT